MNEQWGAWDNDGLTPEEREYVESVRAEPEYVRLREAILLHNEAIEQLAHNDVALDKHDREHCDHLRELEERVKFLEDMLLNDTTQGGSE